MSYTAPAAGSHWFSIDTVNSGPLFRHDNAPGASFAWPSAELALYVPVVVKQACVVRKLWFTNPGTSTGNYDIGLYTAAGVRLLGKGSTAKPASTQLTIWDCTDTTIGPGTYFLALASSNNTDQFAGTSPTAPLATAMGILTEASALPLPATATFALSQTLAVYPILGMFLTTLVA